MNKSLKYGIIGFSIFLVLSLSVYFISGIKKNIEEEKETQRVIAEQLEAAVTVDVENLINEGKWYDITEEDKITLALSSETSIISTVKQYLKDNKIAVFFVYGGPFDSKMQGNYIICTGFNEDGKAKILYPNDNFAEEWRYSFEGLIEFSTKVMLFEM